MTIEAILINLFLVQPSSEKLLLQEMVTNTKNHSYAESDIHWNNYP